MNQLQKLTWLIDTIRRAERISLRDLSDRWMENKDLSDGQPLSRATFNRWRDTAFSQFGIMIECQKSGGYLYYIDNPEEIDEDRLKKWILDSFAVGNIIGENLSLKDRILVHEIPSGRDHLTTILEAMRSGHSVSITYHSFTKPSATFPIDPYCVKLFENRWYVLGYNDLYRNVRLYALDRIESLEIIDRVFELPDGFNATDFFSTAYGVVLSKELPEPVVIRANKEHTPYLKSLPLHNSQKLLRETDEWAEFEYYLVPTYDFVMRLLHVGPMVEVISPASLRSTMKQWISEMMEFYESDL